MADLESNPEMMSTKEFLRRKRKQEYEKAKAIAKQKREEEKLRAAEEKAAIRKASDKALWGLIKEGSALSPKAEEGEAPQTPSDTTYQPTYD